MIHPEHRSKWSHSICERCYAEKEPRREPVRVKDAEVETCCFCGRTHNSGIFYRHDPKGLKCEKPDQGA